MNAARKARFVAPVMLNIVLEPNALAGALAEALGRDEAITFAGRVRYRLKKGSKGPQGFAWAAHFVRRLGR